MSVYSHSFSVKNSNYIEALGYMCTEQMKIPLNDPFAKEQVIVMNSGMKSYLQQFIARQNGICSNVCPERCIQAGTPYSIDQSHCLRCGNCMTACPAGAVCKRETK